MIEPSPVPRSDFPQAADLNDPLTLLQKCEEHALGVEREGSANMPGSLIGGHPSRPHFFAEIARTLRAAAKFVKAHAPVPEVKKEEPLKTEGKNKPVVAG